MFYNKGMLINYAANIINDLKDLDSFVLCIDGYAGSGKTTLANKLAIKLNATLIHVDDFYIPIDKRPIDWFEKPGGNINFDRLTKEVFNPYLKKEELKHNEFKPYIQELQCFDNYPYNSKLIIEGSYSMHPEIRNFSTHTVFLKCDSSSQQRRLKLREKDNFENFKNIWIVKELNYHKIFEIEKSADYVIDTSNLF